MVVFAYIQEKQDRKVMTNILAPAAIFVAQDQLDPQDGFDALLMTGPVKLDRPS